MSSIPNTHIQKRVREDLLSKHPRDSLYLAFALIFKVFRFCLGMASLVGSAGIDSSGDLFSIIVSSKFALWDHWSA